MPDRSELSHPLNVPIRADSVESPTVEYGSRSTVLRFTTDDDRTARVTFENLDSIRISRGEYAPYDPASQADDRSSWVQTISNSPWLRERYEYEKRHYSDAYQWGGDVEEMLEFSHYVFTFHDEFVEAIADGIWMELDDQPSGTAFPWRGLSDEEAAETIPSSGVAWTFRRNSLPLKEIEGRAALCSQTLFEFWTSSNVHGRADWRVTHRVRGGVGKSCLRNSLQTTVAVYDAIPTLSEIQRQIELMQRRNR